MKNQIERAEPSRGAPDARHTPGPWKVGYWMGVCRIPEHVQARNHPGGKFCKYDHEFTPMQEEEWGVSGVGIVSAEPGVSVVWTAYDELKIRPADARLIAQAPDLLAENEKLRAGHVVLLEALRAIAHALHDDKGDYWKARKWLDDHDLYNDDLSGERVLLAVAEAAIKQAERA